MAERMAALMCVDIDLDGEAESGGLDEIDTTKLSAVEVVERELCEIKDGRADALRWLELEELDIDDDILVSLDLPSKFPVSLSLPR